MHVHNSMNPLGKACSAFFKDSGFMPLQVLIESVKKFILMDMLQVVVIFKAANNLVNI